MLPVHHLVRQHRLTIAELTQFEGWAQKFPELLGIEANCINPGVFAMCVHVIRCRGYQQHLPLEDSVIEGMLIE
jgi:hypothetical protein